MRQLWLCLTLLAGGAVSLTAVPGRADDKSKADEIDKLVKQLGGARFTDREKASKALDAIGLPALEALRKAAQSDDPELRRRAGDLVAKLEKLELAARVLAPRRLRLNYKDTPLKEAVEDLAKKSGYAITLDDPEGRLKDRKVTLETDETSFWEAFDKFCDKAGLVESDQLHAVLPGGPPGMGFAGGAGFGGIPAQPPIQIQIQPARIRPIRNAPPRPVQPPAPPPAPPPGLKEGFAADEAPKPDEKPAAPPAVAPARLKLQLQPGVPPAVQPPVGRVPVRQPAIMRGAPGGFGGPGVVPPTATQIILKDGKPEATPTAYSGAVRVRAMDNPANTFGAAAQGEYLVGLKVTPEPKVGWQQTVAVRVDRAIDDQDQKLTPAMGGGAGAPAPGGFPGGAGFGGIQPGFPGAPVMQGLAHGPHRLESVRLSRGEKAAKTLKELSGTITASVLAEPEVLISCDDVLKAAGKTFKGKDSGEIKVVGVDKDDNGRVLVKYELTPPAGMGQGGGFGGFGGGIQIMPAPVPLPAPAPAPLPGLPGAFQVQAAPPAQVQVQRIQIGGGGRGGVVFIGGGAGGQGVELLDDKGNVIPMVQYQQAGQFGPGGNLTMEHHATYQLQKDQKPAKLVYRSSRAVNVDIPFTLKNVKLN